MPESLEAAHLHRFPRELGPSRQRLKLGVGDLRRHRRHAAIGARIEPIGGDVGKRGADGLGDLFRRLDGVGGWYCVSFRVLQGCKVLNRGRGCGFVAFYDIVGNYGQMSM